MRILRALSAVAVLGGAFMACSRFGDESSSTDDAGTGSETGAEAGADSGSTDASEASLDANDGASTVDACGASPPSTLTGGLIASWQFENNLIDSSGHGHTLAPIGCDGGGLAFSPGLVGSAFDPGLTYCALTGSGNLSFGPEFTVSIWANFASSSYPHADMVANAQVYIGAWSLPGGNGTSPLFPTIQIDNGGGEIATVQDTSFDFRNPTHQNVWVHLIAWGSQTKVGLRVNGGPVMEKAFATTALGAAATYYVGREQGGFGWQGSLDEVTHWDRILTAAEMDAVYNCGVGLAH